MLVEVMVTTMLNTKDQLHLSRWLPQLVLSNGVMWTSFTRQILMDGCLGTRRLHFLSQLIIGVWLITWCIITLICIASICEWGLGKSKVHKYKIELSFGANDTKFRIVISTIHGEPLRPVRYVIDTKCRYWGNMALHGAATPHVAQENFSPPEISYMVWPFFQNPQAKTFLGFLCVDHLIELRDGADVSHALCALQ